MIRNPNYSEENFLVPNFEVSWPFYTVESDYLSAWVCLLFAIIFGILAFKRLQIKPIWRNTILSLCALGGLLVFSNFLTFHGPMGKERVRLAQSWDMFHYVIGARYQSELGYDHFYDACLLALREIETEQSDPEFWQRFQYRDMRTYEILPGAAALMQEAEIKAFFSSMQWEQFVQDVTYFYHDLTPEYFYNVFGDHGYNPPPTYTLAAKLFVGSGDLSESKLLLLASIDWILIALALGLIAWGFGVEAALVTVSLFGIAYMSNFSWIGNAFLRFGWFTGIVAGIVFQKRGLAVASGVSLGIAAGLRVFPGILLFSLAFPFIWSWWKEIKAGERNIRSWKNDLLAWHRSNRCVQLMKTVVSAAVLLVVWGITAELVSDRSGVWSEWKDTISLHEGRLSANHVGLRSGITIHPELTSGKIVAADPIEWWNTKKAEILAKRAWIYIPIILLYLGCLLACARKASIHHYLLVGLTSFFFFLDLSGYYYSFMALFPLLFVGRSLRNISMAYLAASLLALLVLSHYWTQQIYQYLDWVYAVSSLVLIPLCLALPICYLLIERSNNRLRST